jgi:dephospho-CoA kinase
MERDKSKVEDASIRLNSQMPIDEKVKYADEIVDNSGSFTDLEGTVSCLVNRMNVEVGWMWMLSWIFPPLALVNGVFYLLQKRIKR